MSNPPPFSELLSRYLRDADRSASWVAARLRVHPATVSRWVNGDTLPRDPETVGRIADVLGVHDRAQREALLRAAGFAYVEGTPVTPTEEFAADPAPDEPPLPPAGAGEQPAEDAAAETEPVSPLPPAPPPWIAHPQLLAAVLAGLALLVLWLVLRPWLTDYPVAAGEATFAIGPWQNLSPGASPHETLFTEGTRQTLYSKLSASPDLQGVSWAVQQMTPPAQNRPTYWLEGRYEHGDGVRLTAQIFDDHGVFVGEATAQERIDSQGAEICILELQNRLAHEILAVLKMKPAPESESAIDALPTTSCQALRLNNEAADLIVAGNAPVAQSLLQQALALDDAYADARNNLARAHELQGQVVLAVREYNRAIELDPRNPIYRYNLALLRERSGQYDDAVALYTAAIELDPLYTVAYNNLGFTYLQMGQPDAALETLRSALTLEAEPGVVAYLHKNLARTQLALGQPAEAIPALQEAMALHADAYDAPFAEALFYLAQAYSETGETGSACATLSEYETVAENDDPQRRAEAETLRAALMCGAGA